MSKKSTKVINPLSVFGDAVREVLGLDPIYQTGRGNPSRTEVERFYMDPIPEGNGRTARHSGNY